MPRPSAPRSLSLICRRSGLGLPFPVIEVADTGESSPSFGARVTTGAGAGWARASVGGGGGGGIASLADAWAAKRGEDGRADEVVTRELVRRCMARYSLA